MEGGMKKRKVRLSYVAERLTREYPIEYPKRYGYFSHGDIVRVIFKAMKNDNFAYIPPMRIDTVLDKANAKVKLEHNVRLLLRATNKNED
jgi:hypothetical protein